MKISLQNKLNLTKAKSYATKLNGVTSFKISLLHEDDFVWHRKMLKEINKIDNFIERKSFNIPLNINSLISLFASTLNVQKNINCNIFYVGEVCISLCVEDLSAFILSLFSINGTYDFSLAFTSPDRVIVLSDNEYEVEFYYMHK
ncbi:hypothetical protein B1H58_11200 [Pantoea alhagi]|uniref:Uncharacterized protein n=1 Tax=Pantoea alhagi TaxID=1891675 RepID=A0A1W6B671_9GAMM|nr:hypothetical protein B1H58_11200 [Pantoea alhagi]